MVSGVRKNPIKKCREIVKDIGMLAGKTMVRKKQMIYTQSQAVLPEGEILHILAVSLLSCGIQSRNLRKFLLKFHTG